MIFADSWFGIFILISILSVWLLPLRFRPHTLLLACLFFHGHYAGPAGMAPILIMSTVVYFTLLTKKRSLAIITILFIVSALAYYKYRDFINEILGTQLAKIAAPLAISFFVFEWVHLLSDRFLNKSRNFKSIDSLSPINFGLFVLFFPTLAAGPIKRWQDFIPQIKQMGFPGMHLVASGILRIIIGYYFKWVLGDGLLRETPANPIYWNGSLLTLSLTLGLRIYFDFSGYSHLAIGLARLMNIKIPENFRFPYFSTSIIEFWRRWHISLSQWIRDYIYISLGGNRRGLIQKGLFLIFSMILCGLWHGPAVHFIIWGCLHGVALLINHLFLSRISAFLNKYKSQWINGTYALCSWAVTFVFVQFAWLWFFYDQTTVIQLFREKPLW